MRFYFRFQTMAEAIIAFAVSITFYLLSDRWTGIFEWPGSGLQADLMLAVMGLSASLLGFVLAASTFLVSHIQHPELSTLRKSKGYLHLLRNIRSSLWKLLALTVCAGLMTPVDTNTFREISPFLIFLIAWNLLTLIALIWATIAIVSLPLSQN